MSCPQCGNAEIDLNGKCPVCGYQVPPPDTAPESSPERNDGNKPAGAIELDYSENAHDGQPQEGIPQWRKDLSARLQEIKLKKEATVAAASKIKTENRVPQATAPQTRTPPAAATRSARSKPVERIPMSKPVSNPPAPIPRQKTLQPVGMEAAAPHKLHAKASSPRDIQNFIDDVVARQSPGDDVAAHPAEDQRTPPVPTAEGEGKLILLSRTLSGLVDLICIVICTGTFIIAADFFSGIIVLDSISLIDFAALLLMTFFVYSLFFAGAANQTIGMMITDLRIVGADRRRPSLLQIVIRCCCFLLSMFGLGIGLLWSLFSRESQCLHDRLSGTKVVRV